MTGAVEWSLVRRIAFRFGFALGALLLFPFPIGSIPYTDWLESALETRGWYGLKVDPVKHTIEVTVGYREKKPPETWHYRLPAPDRLVIDAVHRGRTLHLTMHREPEGVLLSRGFHWFNEVPFNR